MSGWRIAGVVLVAIGLFVHAYVARKAPRFRKLIIVGAFFEALGVTILATLRGS